MGAQGLGRHHEHSADLPNESHRRCCPLGHFLTPFTTSLSFLFYKNEEVRFDASEVPSRTLILWSPMSLKIILRGKDCLPHYPTHYTGKEACQGWRGLLVIFLLKQTEGEIRREVISQLNSIKGSPLALFELLGIQSKDHSSFSQIFPFSCWQIGQGGYPTKANRVPTWGPTLYRVPALPPEMKTALIILAYGVKNMKACLGWASRRK